MLAIRQRVSRLEAAMNTRLSYMFYHHNVLGLLAVFVGIPVATFVMVCGATSLFLAAASLVLGWV